MLKNKQMNSFVLFDFAKQATAGIYVLDHILIYYVSHSLNSLENLKNQNLNKV